MESVARYFTSPAGGVTGGNRPAPPPSRRFQRALVSLSDLSLTYPPDPKVGQAGKIFVLGSLPFVFLSEIRRDDSRAEICEPPMRVREVGRARIRKTAARLPLSHIPTGPIGEPSRRNCRTWELSVRFSVRNPKRRLTSRLCELPREGSRAPTVVLCSAWRPSLSHIPTGPTGRPGWRNLSGRWVFAQISMGNPKGRLTSEPPTKIQRTKPSRTYGQNQPETKSRLRFPKAKAAQ